MVAAVASALAAASKESTMEETREFHVHLDVESALKNMTDVELAGMLVSSVTGESLSAEEARRALREHLANGHKLLPLDKSCEGFDSAGGGCPGHVKAKHVPVAERANQWIVGQDTGMSSIAMWAHMQGVRKFDRSAPLDPSDLGRCLRLLELIPEWRPRVQELASLGPRWAALTTHWKELEELLAGEVGIDWKKGRTAPLTFARMNEILSSADR